MKKVLSLALIIFLSGCGGSSTANSPTDSGTKKESPDEKGELAKSYKTDGNGKITTIKLAGSAEDIAISKKALFVAKGEDGIDVVKIGYNDSIKSELINAIDGINAKSISLSKDGKKLYVVNEEGFVNVVDISNISNPVKEKVLLNQQDIKKFVLSKDQNYKYLPKNKEGLYIYDVSNPTNEELIKKFDKSNAYDVVLADKDTKALIAAGAAGINLLDITKPTSPNMVVNFAINGGTKGLSLNKEQGILFVANGDKGVLVYYLNSMLDKITKR